MVDYASKLFLINCGGEDVNWLVFALLTAFFWGIAPVFARIGLVKVDPIIALAMRTFSITVGLILIITITGKWEAVRSIEGRSAMFLVAEGLMASLFGHYAYFYALKLGNVAQVVPITASFPIVAMIAAALFLGEKITLIKVVGAFLIVAGAYLVRL